MEKANPVTIRLASILEPARNLPIPVSALPVLELNWAQVTWDFPPLHAIPADHLDADAYQIALIPIEIGKNGASLLSPEGGLLLPLTWGAIASQINNHPRHSDRSYTESVVQFGEVRINFLTMEVYRSGQLLTLTAMEFKILKFFVLNAFRVLSRDELLNEVWGYENYPSTRTVDNRVMRLRQKLEADPVKPVHFRTVHGVGYKFVP